MSSALFNEYLVATSQTLYMTFTATLIAVFVGLPLGVMLYATRQKHLIPHPVFSGILEALTNGVRSIPFLILLIALIPITRWIVGTSIGTTAAIVPLSIAAIPFFARLVESTLLEVHSGLLEAGVSMGAASMQMILYILVPEALPGLINNITITLINILGYSTMAGAIGGGGLGDLAIRYGYQRFQVDVMFVTIVILIVFVQLFQWVGQWSAKVCTHR